MMITWYLYYNVCIVDGVSMDDVSMAMGNDGGDDDDDGGGSAL